MGDKTGISWTDATWNAIRGCSRIAPECVNCYAEAMAARFCDPGLPYHGLARRTAKGPRWTGEVRMVPGHLADPLRWQRPRRIFVNSMSDLFHETLSNEQIAAIFGVMAAAPRHTFQVLTKRPERMRAWFEWAENANIPSIAMNALIDAKFDPGCGSMFDFEEWPLPNVHLGFSAGTQARYDAGVIDLLACPAAVHWCSIEPMLEAMSIDAVSQERSAPGVLNPLTGEWWPAVGDADEESRGRETEGPRLSWVVVGGESGHGARPFCIDWARTVIRQCQESATPVFFKQFGAYAVGPVTTGMEFRSFQEWVNKASTRLGGRFDGACIDKRGRVCASGADFARARDQFAFPVTVHPRLRFVDRSGSAPGEWPVELRVQEFPA